VLRAYRQFPSVKVATKDRNAEILSPSVVVDLMRHQHLLDNANYAHDCLLLCDGHFVKHDADGGWDVEARKNRLVAPRRALLECYGEEGGELDRSLTGPWKEVFAAANNDNEDDLGSGGTKGAKDAVGRGPRGDLELQPGKACRRDETTTTASVVGVTKTATMATTASSKSRRARTRFSSPKPG
jgi:hypothetical protein